MRNISLDLKTMGVTSGAPVLAIGAVEFDLEHGVTGRDLRPDLPVEHVGVHHNAHADALTQAVHMLKILAPFCALPDER